MSGARPTLALALALGAAAGGFGLRSLYVPAIALVVLVAGSVAWVELAVRVARPRALPGPATVEEGGPYPLRIRLDPRRPPLPGGELAHPALAAPVQIGAGGSGEHVAELRFELWGRRVVEAATLHVSDPLRLHERRLTVGTGGSVLVLPRVEPVVAPAWGEGGSAMLRGRGPGTGAGVRRAEAIDPEVDGLRPWRPGSPASRIHWPSVARTGELVERGIAAGSDSSPLVVLDYGELADPDSLARALRAAASLCVHLAAGGGCSLLLPGDPRPLAVDRELRSWPRAHARLASVDPERPMRARAPRAAGAVFWVTPTPNRIGERTPGGYLVTPAALAGRMPAFEVAGCTGYASSVAGTPLAAVATRRAG